jgi:hypothetical protein
MGHYATQPSSSPFMDHGEQQTLDLVARVSRSILGGASEGYQAVGQLSR